ncbi:hypothetical protein PIB30_024250 [Stylosanthes scabra]|uniref:Uncharacterized protein n=1 Tax=Stylosanthes scabra TaxID=79078 RepID=A0ABU6TA06_9FABA|nr:hypothetical protein [Stylosanthes scabra]
MDLGGKESNQICAAFVNVVGEALHLVASEAPARKWVSRVQVGILILPSYPLLLQSFFQLLDLFSSFSSPTKLILELVWSGVPPNVVGANVTSLGKAAFLRPHGPYFWSCFGILNLKLYVHLLGDPPFVKTRKNGPRQRRQCSGVNTEPDEPSPLQAWAVAMSPIVESPMKQAGGRTCKTLRRSSQTEHKYTCSGGGGKVHVLRFRSRAQEHVPILLWRKDRASPYPCCARQIGSLLIGRVGSVFSSGQTDLDASWAC